MLQELINALEAAKTGSPEKSVESAIAIYHAANANAAAYKLIADQAKEIINDVMAETSQMEYITQAGVSVSYNAAALDALSASDDGIARLLAPHRKVTERAGTLRVTSPK